MENPYLLGWAKLGRRTLAQSYALGNAKVGQNHEFRDSFNAVAVSLGGVDKAWARPYLCAIVSMAIAFVLLTFLAVEPRTADFPLIGERGPVGAFTVARHGELIGSSGTTSRRQGLAARHRNLA
jgi:hypothetical protein